MGILGAPFVDQFETMFVDYKQQKIALEGIQVAKTGGGVSEVKTITTRCAATFFVPNGGAIYAFQGAKPIPVEAGAIVLLMPGMRLNIAPPSAP